MKNKIKLFHIVVEFLKRKYPKYLPPKYVFDNYIKPVCKEIESDYKGERSEECKES